MKIALFGYGKMGKTIERIARDRGHSIVARIDISNNGDSIVGADIAIDFSVPDQAFNNIIKCFNKNIPIVSGTTGWLNNYPDAVQRCKETNGAFIYASNFSLGVNLFFELNSQLAKMMTNYSDFDLSLEEIHHTAKIDAPSGTAISLAEDIIARSAKKSWSPGVTKKDDEIPIISKRIKDVPGIHLVNYESASDQIEIKHTAKNREGFALGAIIAAEWLQDKKGVYTMKDVLGI